MEGTQGITQEGSSPQLWGPEDQPGREVWMKPGVREAREPTGPARGSTCLENRYSQG